jgi:hypothetical protein
MWEGASVITMVTLSDRSWLLTYDAGSVGKWMCVKPIALT